MERAYQEMKDYGFYTSMGHGCYKDYIYDYNRDWQAHNQLPAAITAQPAVKAERRFSESHEDSQWRVEVKLIGLTVDKRLC